MWEDKRNCFYEIIWNVSFHSIKNVSIAKFLIFVSFWKTSIHHELLFPQSNSVFKCECIVSTKSLRIRELIITNGSATFLKVFLLQLIKRNLVFSCLNCVELNFHKKISAFFRFAKMHRNMWPTIAPANAVINFIGFAFNFLHCSQYQKKVGAKWVDLMCDLAPFVDLKYV